MPEFSDNIAVKLDGKYLACDRAPIELNGCIMLPLRLLCEQSGAGVDWKDGAVSITYGGDVINLTAGSDTARINGVDVKMDTSADIYDGVMMVSANFIAHALGYELKYENNIAELIKK